MRYYYKTTYGYTGRLNIPYGTICHNYFYCDDCANKQEVIKKHSTRNERIVKVFTGKVFDEDGYSKYDGRINYYEPKR